MNVLKILFIPIVLGMLSSCNRTRIIEVSVPKESTKQTQFDAQTEKDAISTLDSLVKNLKPDVDALVKLQDDAQVELDALVKLEDDLKLLRLSDDTFRTIDARDSQKLLDMFAQIEALKTKISVVNLLDKSDIMENASDAALREEESLPENVSVRKKSEDVKALTTTGLRAIKAITTTEGSLARKKTAMIDKIELAGKGFSQLVGGRAENLDDILTYTVAKIISMEDVEDIMLDSRFLDLRGDLKKANPQFKLALQKVNALLGDPAKSGVIYQAKLEKNRLDTELGKTPGSRRETEDIGRELDRILGNLSSELFKISQNWVVNSVEKQLQIDVDALINQPGQPLAKLKQFRTNMQDKVMQTNLPRYSLEELQFYAFCSLDKAAATSMFAQLATDLTNERLKLKALKLTAGTDPKLIQQAKKKKNQLIKRQTRWNAELTAAPSIESFYDAAKLAVIRASIIDAMKESSSRYNKSSTPIWDIIDAHDEKILEKEFIGTPGTKLTAVALRLNLNKIKSQFLNASVVDLINQRNARKIQKKSLEPLRSKFLLMPQVVSFKAAVKTAVASINALDQANPNLNTLVTICQNLQKDFNDPTKLNIDIQLKCGTYPNTLPDPSGAPGSVQLIFNAPDDPSKYKEHEVFSKLIAAGLESQRNPRNLFPKNAMPQMLKACRAHIKDAYKTFEQKVKVGAGATQNNGQLIPSLSHVNWQVAEEGELKFLDDIGVKQLKQAPDAIKTQLIAYVPPMDYSLLAKDNYEFFKNIDLDGKGLTYSGFLKAIKSEFFPAMQNQDYLDISNNMLPKSGHPILSMVSKIFVKKTYDEIQEKLQTQINEIKRGVVAAAIGGNVDALNNPVGIADLLDTHAKISTATDESAARATVKNLASFFNNATPDLYLTNLNFIANNSQARVLTPASMMTQLKNKLATDARSMTLNTLAALTPINLKTQPIRPKTPSDGTSFEEMAASIASTMRQPIFGTNSGPIDLVTEFAKLTSELTTALTKLRDDALNGHTMLVRTKKNVQPVVHAFSVIFAAYIDELSKLDLSGATLADETRLQEIHDEIFNGWPAKYVGYFKNFLSVVMDYEEVDIPRPFPTAFVPTMRPIIIDLQTLQAALKLHTGRTPVISAFETMVEGFLN